MEDKKSKSTVTGDDKLFGALGYVSFVSVIMYVIKKNNEYVAFHSRQGIILFIASLLVVIPAIGWVIAGIAYVLMVIGFIRAYDGDWFKMPFIGDLADKLK